MSQRSADKAGLTDDQVRSLASGDHRDACWPDPADRAVLAAVDGLHDDHDLDDSTWQALVAAVGDDGALDVILVAGWYHAISYAVRALRLPLEPGTAASKTLAFSARFRHVFPQVRGRNPPASRLGSGVAV